jgi:isopenicillin N synthase-like dioxygenase
MATDVANAHGSRGCQPSPSTPFPEDVECAPLVTLSLSRLLAGDVSEHSRLYAASKELGFFYLDLSGCEQGSGLLDSANSLFDISRDFFDLPLATKRQYDFAGKAKYYGYKGMGAEVIDGKGTLDRNEIYNIPKDDILCIAEPVPSPELITSKRDLLKTYINQNNDVIQVLFNSLTSSMKLPTTSSFAARHRLSEPSGCHVRCIHAPPQELNDRGTALGEHTDFGSLTILFNRIGGLQVLLPDTSKWVYVRPMPGCAIVNLGDAMVKFTAGVLRSNMHRVISPPGRQAELNRYSLVYFCRPENDVKLARLRGGDIDALAATDEELTEGESAAEWLHRRHMGRKVQWENWENSKGTDAARL